MNLAAIYHRTSNQYCYPSNEEELIVNIKTGYDVERVFLYHGDPYEAGIMGGEGRWTGVREEIVYKKRLEHQLWWTTTLRPRYRRNKYYFELQGKTETVYYFEDGFYTKEEMDRSGKELSYFIFPWMNSVDINRPPAWVNDTIWYQIFPERFCKGDPSIDPDGVKEWKCEKITGYNDHYGGDLKGILDKLDYFKDLGINGLYLTPVFEADSNHKYNTRNYRKVDPHFGTNELLRKLSDEAHKRGIRIMLDGVFNHTGTDIFFWKDVLAKGRDSEYFDWYMINTWPIEQGRDTRDGRYYSFAFEESMPKLNTNHPGVRKYLLDTVAFWITEFDIDGLRLDVGNEVSHLFLKELRSMTAEMKPDFYLLGEIWHDAIEWLKGDEYDSVMNYPLSTVISNFWVYPEWKKIRFEQGVNQSFTTYMQQNNDVMFNLLDSHDTNRLIDKVGDIDIFYQQLAVLYTMPGSPCIFYGTEIAMEGGHDPDCRRCMPWDEIGTGKYDERIGEIKKLIALRRTEAPARSRNFHFPNEYEEDRLVEYIKLSDKDRSIKVLLNCSKESVVLHEIKNSDILYSRKVKGGKILPKGILIYRI